MPSRTTGRVDVRKNHAGNDSLTTFVRIRANRKCAQQIFLFWSCRVGRGDRVTVTTRGREVRYGIAARFPSVSEFHVRQGPHEFQRDLSGRSSHLHLLDARPCTRRVAMCSTRSGNASFDPALVGTIAIMAGEKKWRGNRCANSRNEYFEVAPARLEPSPRPPAWDLFYR